LCLSVSAEIPRLDEAALRDLVRDWPEAALGFGVSGRGLLRRRRPRLEAHACDLLADDADWNASTWSMTPEGVATLTRVWIRLFDRFPGEVVAEVIFAGDRAEVEESLTRDEFLAIVKSGAIGTKTRYFVRP
jgi:hypothetical protein